VVGMARTGNETWAAARNAEPIATSAAASPAPGSAPGPAPSPRKIPPRVKGRVSRLLRRGWIAVVLVIVVAIASFVVFRLHGVFGKTETTRPGSGINTDPKPFNPKTVTYEIFGPPGTVATINYLDLDAQPQEVKDTTLPWSITLTTTAPAASANIVAQGDGNTIGCRITVNGEVKDVETSNGVNAQTFCLVKSA
jgi:Mycobacterium membrane protein